MLPPIMKQAPNTDKRAAITKIIKDGKVEPIV